jgi:hypothetical protein
MSLSRRIFDFLHYYFDSIFACIDVWFNLISLNNTDVRFKRDMMVRIDRLMWRISMISVWILFIFHSIDIDQSAMHHLTLQITEIDHSENQWPTTMVQSYKKQSNEYAKVYQRKKRHRGNRRLQPFRARSSQRSVDVGGVCWLTNDYSSRKHCKENEHSNYVPVAGADNRQVLNNQMWMASIGYLSDWRIDMQRVVKCSANFVVSLFFSSALKIEYIISD